MAENVGTGEVTIVPNTKAFGAKLQSGVAAPLKGLSAAGGPIGKFNSLFSQFGVSATLGFAAAGAAAIGFAKSAVDAYSESQQVLTQFANALANSPAIIDKSTQAFEQQATALQGLTGVQDEAILSADTILTRFDLTREQIQATIPLVLDFAQATGQDAASAATGLGRALLGNTRALKTIGVTFKATGDRAADLAAIQDILAEKVGGAAEAFGTTYAGKLAILSAAFDDLKERLGQSLIPLLSEVAASLLKITDAVNGLIDILPGDSGLGGILAAAFDASPVGFFGDAVGSVSDLLHGRFLDSAKGAANALIPFWDPFNTGADEAQQQLEALAGSVSKGEGHLDGYHQHLIAVARGAEDFGASLKKLPRILGQFATATDFRQWRRESIEAFDSVRGSLSDLAGEAHLTADAILKSFTRQLTAMQNYQTNWQKLLDRGLPASLAAQLQEMGSEGAGIVAALAKANDDKFDQIMRKWQQSHGVAKTTANQIEGVGRAVKILPDGKVIRVVADISDAQDKLNQLERQMRGVLAVGSTGVFSFHPSQHGFNGTVREPTLFLAGEAGPEHVEVTPTGSGGHAAGGGGDGGGDVHLHFHGDVYGMDDFERRVSSAAVQVFTGGAR